MNGVKEEQVNEQGNVKHEIKKEILLEEIEKFEKSAIEIKKEQEDYNDVVKKEDENKDVVKIEFAEVYEKVEDNSEDEHEDQRIKIERGNDQMFQESNNNYFSGKGRLNPPDQINGTLFQCMQCDFSATESYHIELHAITHTTEPPFQCSECVYKTPNSCNFNSHIFTHKPPHIICPHCCSCFTKMDNLQIHLKNKHPVLKCKFCDFLAYSLADINNHINQYHDRPPDQINVTLFQCTQCDFSATEAYHIELHAIIHATESSFQCTECVYKTPNSCNFNSHIFTHKPHVCPHCRKCFTIMDNLQSHLKNKHPVLKCRFCDFLSYSLVDINNHMDQYHNHHREIESTKMKFSMKMKSTKMKSTKIKHDRRQESVHCLFSPLKKCQQCTFIYTKSLSLEMHQIVHETNPPYQCATCKYTTRRCGRYSSHIFTHTGDKPHFCPYCPGTYTQRQTMLSHIKKRHP